MEGGPGNGGGCVGPGWGSGHTRPRCFPLTNAVRIENRSEERSRVCERRRPREASEGSARPALTEPARPGPARLTHLLEDVLLAHQLLPLPVGLGEDHLKDVLPRVGATRDEVNQVFQQLGDRP